MTTKTHTPQYTNQERQENIDTHYQWKIKAKQLDAKGWIKSAIMTGVITATGLGVLNVNQEKYLEQKAVQEDLTLEEVTAKHQKGKKNMLYYR